MATRTRILQVRVWRVLTKRILASTRASLCKYPMLTSHGFCIRCHLYQNIPDLGCIGSPYKLCHCFNICIRCPLYPNIPGLVLDALVPNANFSMVSASGAICTKISQVQSWKHGHPITTFPLLLYQVPSVPKYLRSNLGSIVSRCQLSHCFNICIMCHWYLNIRCLLFTLFQTVELSCLDKNVFVNFPISFMQK